MASFLKTGSVGTALAVSLAFSPAGPAQAQSVPASFDCAKADSTVEKLICAHAVLRWQDLALSRAYRAARDAVSGSARDDLLASQRDWAGERDRRCIADRSFRELADSSAGLGEQAYECLKIVYLDRRLALQDSAAPPLQPGDARTIDLGPIAAARPEIVEDGVPLIADIRLSPDGALAAFLLPSLELDGPDQIWLYRVTDGRLVPATPAPDRQQPHPDGSPMAIRSMAWRGDTLYARVALWSRDSQGETAPEAIYAATADGSTRLDTAPADIAALPGEEDDAGPAAQDEMTEGDGDSPAVIRSNRDFLAWIDDPGHGAIELKMRPRAGGQPAYLVAWGGWDLAGYLFGSERSQLVYSGGTGITTFDMATHKERRIAATSQGDLPRAISGDAGLIVWSTRNACGSEFRTEQDENAPERFCLAHLPKPEEGK